jgi:hypothetical protein
MRVIFDDQEDGIACLQSQAVVRDLFDRTFGRRREVEGDRLRLRGGLRDRPRGA